ncbi:MAG: HYR domain-containing protein [Verrucomicrobiota bacterium]
MIYGQPVAPAFSTTLIYQGGLQIGSYLHASQDELAIAVAGGTVRQVSYYDGAGSEYTLAGVPTGTQYQVIPAVYDGTSDGTSIYGWNWFTASLEKYDLNWNYQSTLFSLGSSYSRSFMGVTYDSQNNSVWIAPRGFGPQGVLYDYSLDGQLLGTLNLANSLAVGNGLAYDPADNTLWFFSWTDQRYEQYSKDGSLLNTLTGMTRIYGAEFASIPEPPVQPPTITCPTQIVVNNDPSQCSALVSYPMPITSGGTGNVLLVCSPPSGSAFPIGTTTVTCTATDEAGNTAMCSFNVTVNDTELPVASCAVVKAPVLHTNPLRIVGWFQLLATDNCDPDPLLYIKGSAGSFVAGPFHNGDQVEIAHGRSLIPGQAPSTFGGNIATIQLNGDALLWAVDSSGNTSTPIKCK